MEVHLRIASTHYDGDHDQPSVVSIEGLWLRLGSIQSLAAAIQRWVDQPLEALAGSAFSGHFPLARLEHQSLDLRFGPRADTISGSNPVVTASFSAGPLRGDIHFVTDQSCLRNFAADLGVLAC